MKWFVLAVAVLMYGLVVAFPHRKAIATLAAAALVVAAGAVSVSHAFGVLINWNVLMIYLGSLVIAELFIYSRVPAYIADKIVEKTANPGLAVVLLWSAFFSGEKSGVLNILLSHLGIAPQTYLTRSEWVIPIIILIATWKGAGATALIYMAGMSSVSPELYEAAAIDGAGIWQRIIHIMIPAIKKLAGTLLILQIISVFQIMYEPMVLTKGGPDNASLSLMQLMWQYAFGGSMNYGKASAVAVIVTLILLVMTAIYSYFDRKESDWD